MKDSITFATSKYLPEINLIYNQAVKDGLRTAHIHSLSEPERQSWFSEHSKIYYPIFVYLRDKRVLGWLSISAYRSDRQALDEVVEISYYVHYDFHQQGIGTKLMERAINFCLNHCYRIMVAILVSENKPSIALLCLKSLDFKKVAEFGTLFITRTSSVIICLWPKV